MKTNLIFKRTVEGRIEMIMVPVDIPLDKKDGWILASCCDTMTILEEPKPEPVTVSGNPITAEPTILTVLDATPTDYVDAKDASLETAKAPIKAEPVPVGGKYDSKTTGTARLVRYKDRIRITYRKGKTTFNRNDPNSVCIDDMTKQHFFNSVKRQYGSGVDVWQLVLGDKEYAYYNSLIDKLYEDGRVAYNKTHVDSIVVSG